MMDTSKILQINKACRKISINITKNVIRKELQNFCTGFSSGEKLLRALTNITYFLMEPGKSILKIGPTNGEAH